MTTNHSDIQEFNFQHGLTKMPFTRTTTSPGAWDYSSNGLNEVLARHPDIREALFKAIDEDRAEGSL